MVVDVGYDVMDIVVVVDALGLAVGLGWGTRTGGLWVAVLVQRWRRSFRVRCAALFVQWQDDSLLMAAPHAMHASKMPLQFCRPRLPSWNRIHPSACVDLLCGSSLAWAQLIRV